jgi:hypothetical protein
VYSGALPTDSLLSMDREVGLVRGGGGGGIQGHPICQLMKRPNANLNWSIRLNKHKKSLRIIKFIRKLVEKKLPYFLR